MLRVSDRAGSEHGLRLTSCSILPSDIATSWASRLNDFAALWLACRCPLSTLRPTPRDVQRMTRGLSNSPFLPSIELSSTTIYRLTLAHCYCIHSFSGPIQLGWNTKREIFPFSAFRVTVLVSDLSHYSKKLLCGPHTPSKIPAAPCSCRRIWSPCRTLAGAAAAHESPWLCGWYRWHPADGPAQSHRPSG